MQFFKLFAVFSILTFLMFSCSFNHQNSSGSQRRQNFTRQEQHIMQAARGIISRAYFGTLITIDQNGNAKARLMEPFAPEKYFVIYLATNPKSRKVQEIQQNHQATLHYVDAPRTGYVSLYGSIDIVTNDSLKKAHWKNGWERFYPNKSDGYMLLKFIPDYLEVISIRDSLTGNANNWQPARVEFFSSSD